MLCRRRGGLGLLESETVSGLAPGQHTVTIVGTFTAPTAAPDEHGSADDLGNDAAGAAAHR